MITGLVAAAVMWVAGGATLVLAGYSALFLVVGEGSRKAEASSDYRPAVTVMIPASGHSPTLPATLGRVAGLEYDKRLVQTLVAIDEGDEISPPVAAAIAAHGELVVVRGSRGKPSALNQSLARSSGDLLLLLDEDTVIRSDCLLDMLPCLRREDVWAVVGTPYPTNAPSGVLPLMLWAEAAAWAKAAAAKCSRRLFVPATGFFALVRKAPLLQVGGWEEGALAEDADLSVRLYARGWRVEYSHAEAGIESPTSLGALAAQRLRWYRGLFQACFPNFGTVARFRGWRALDCTFTLLAPLAGVGLLVLAVGAPFFPPALPLVLALLAAQAVGIFMAVPKVRGPSRLGLAAASVPYVFFQSAVAWAAFLSYALRIRMSWRRTRKAGEGGP